MAEHLAGQAVDHRMIFFVDAMPPHPKNEPWNQ
jgi:hypothetical protein